MRGVIDSPARRARLTSWIDTMLSPPRSKKLSSMPTRSSPSTSANSEHRIASCGVRGARCECARTQLRLRQRPAVELAVRRQRQPLQHHQRGRHHVVRQLPRQRGPQRRRVQHRARRRHHIADQPLAAAATDPAARSRRPATRPAAATSTASISPGSIRNPRSFTCASARPRNSSTPSGPPPRQVPGPVHPAAGRAVRVGDKPLRRQRRPVQIAPRQTRRPRCTARPQHPQEQAQDRRPKRRPGNSRSDGRSGVKARRRAFHSWSRRLLSRSDRRR